MNTRPKTARMLVHHICNRETISYMIFGVLTTMVNIGVFELFLLTGANYRIANLIALIVAILFAYIVNKLFVFRTRTESPGALVREFGRFSLARGSTMGIDWFGLIVLVSVLGVSEHIGKIIVTAIVVILNYILGKFLVFRKKKSYTPVADSPDHR